MPTDPALAAYEACVSVYNGFNDSNDYEMWLGRSILAELRKHGLSEPGTALDVGCGTSGRCFRSGVSRHGSESTRLKEVKGDADQERRCDDSGVSISKMARPPLAGGSAEGCAGNDVFPFTCLIRTARSLGEVESFLALSLLSAVRAKEQNEKGGEAMLIAQVAPVVSTVRIGKHS